MEVAGRSTDISAADHQVEGGPATVLGPGGEVVTTVEAGCCALLLRPFGVGGEVVRPTGSTGFLVQVTTFGCRLHPLRPLAYGCAAQVDPGGNRKVPSA